MKKILIFFAVAALLSSCYSSKKAIYLQGINEGARFNSVDFEYLLQPGDVLSIVVKSLDELNAQIFNIQSQPNYGNVNGNSLFLSGYTINGEGNIKLPILGDIKMENISVGQAEQIIQAEVDKYLKNSTVIVKMVSFKVSVLGDVKNPGYYYFFNAKGNIFEGLSMAGDITPTGNHKQIKLIRQTLSGSEAHLLDLTDPKVIESEFFYLLPNDIIYVEPLRANTTRRNLELISYISSGLSISLAIYGAFFK